MVGSLSPEVLKEQVGVVVRDVATGRYADGWT